VRDRSLRIAVPSAECVRFSRRSSTSRHPAHLPGGGVVGLLNILRSRPFRLAVLLFQALWLNVVLPGHSRGAVSVPGGGCEACRIGAEKSSCHQPSPSKPNGSDPAPGDPASHCAICYFAAMLSLPPAIDLSPPALRFLELRDVPIAERVVSTLFSATYDGRAPPPSQFHLA
jgi:hypothetical protein